MGKQQAVEKTTALTFAIRHPERFKQSQKEFAQIVEFMQTLFAEAGLTGSYQIQPVQPTRGSAANKDKGMRFTGDDSRGALTLIVQLGSNDTSWKCKLYPPVGANPVEVRDRVGRALEHRKQGRRPAKTEPTDFVVATVNDLESIGLALASLFPERTSEVPSIDITNAFKDQYSWTDQHAEEAIALLESKNYLEVAGTNGSRLIRAKNTGALADVLVTLGALKEAPVATPLPNGVDLDHQFESLKRFADDFSGAQSFLTGSEVARQAITARIDRARGEITRAEAELVQLDAQRTNASRIVADPAYATAASKVGQIRAILGANA